LKQKFPFKKNLKPKTQPNNIEAKLNSTFFAVSVPFLAHVMKMAHMELGKFEASGVAGKSAG